MGTLSNRRLIFYRIQETRYQLGYNWHFKHYISKNKSNIYVKKCRCWRKLEKKNNMKTWKLVFQLICKILTIIYQN